MNRRMHSALASALSLVCFAAAAMTRAAAPETADYEIDLEAPPGQRKLLEQHLDLYRWRGSERMSDEQLRRLVRQAPQQLRDILATEGFYSPSVEASIQDHGGRSMVKLVVVPGQAARVSSVDLQVSGPFDDGSAANNARLAAMRAAWSLAPDSVFRPDDWESAKRNALKALLLARYPTAAIVESRATVNPETGGVALQLTLDSGPAFTFGALAITGLRRYPFSIIERLNPITPGEPYDQAKLLELQSRLQDSPYFASAAVTVDKDPQRPAGVPVRVEVSENPSRKLGFGVGISTDTGVRGQVDYGDINFLGRAWRLGGALKLDQKRQSLGGELQFPPGEPGFRNSVTALTERTDISGQVTRKISVGARRAITHGSTEFAYGLRYLAERQDLEGAATTRSVTLSPSYSWTRRALDSLLYPTRGYLINLQTDAAARALLSDQDMLRGYAKAVYFHPLGRRDQVILRGELGALAASRRQYIPSDFLFRTGGDQTVRGYAYQSLGVRQGSAIVGGRYLAVASAEYVHWLDAKWGAAAFVDAGDAADSLHNFKPVYGYGAGARWKSPVGPLNLDVAYGRETRKLRLHFSVGFSF